MAGLITIQEGITPNAPSAGYINIFASTANQLGWVLPSGQVIFPAAANFQGQTLITTAAGTTTLTNLSTYQQIFQGSTTQTCVLPVTSTLIAGTSFWIKNESTGLVTVQSSGLNSVVVLDAGDSALITCILITGTTASSWDLAIPAQRNGDALQAFAALTQPVTNSSTNVATTAYVNALQQYSMATLPLNLGATGGGNYSFASTGSGASFAVTVTSSTVSGITSITAPGSGYNIGDLIILNSGGYNAVIRVLTLTGTGILTAGILYGGTNYAAGTYTSTSLTNLAYTYTLTGTLTSNAIFLVTNGTAVTQSNQWIVNNNTTGSYTVKWYMCSGSSSITTTGTGVLLPPATAGANTTASLISTDGSTDIWFASSYSQIFTANNLIMATLPVTASAANVTLTANGPGIIYVTGSVNQGFILPPANTLTLGTSYTFNNDSTGNIMVYNNAGTSLNSYVLPGSYVVFVCDGIGSSAGNWDSYAQLPSTWFAGTAGLYVPTTIITANIQATASSVQPALGSAPTATLGSLYLNTATNQWQGYNGTNWTQLGGGATGGINSNGGSDSVFNENDNTLTANYTIGQGSYVSNVTISNATPAVCTLASHGYVQESQIHFKTTGTLPTPILADTVYYVLSAGLTANTFQISTTMDGANVNTSSTSSGTISVGKIRNAEVVGPYYTAVGATVTVPSGSALTVI